VVLAFERFPQLWDFCGEVGIKNGRSQQMSSGRRDYLTEWPAALGMAYSITMMAR
jgi:hypothetical protein